MKKLYVLIIIALCILLSRPGSAQFNIYHPFPTSNAVWSQGYEYYDGTCLNNTYFNYYISNDTIVNGKTYHVVHMSGGYEFVDCMYTTYTYWNSYDNVYSAIREDSSKHIYMLNGSKDTLLYDFNLNIGDTLPNTFINQKSNCLFVSAIDSILIGTTYRREFKIRDSSINDLYEQIEGIGNTVGLFQSINIGFSESSSILECFDQNNKCLFPDSNYNCPLYVLGVSTIPKTKSAITVYPNPSCGKFNIAFSNPELVLGPQTIEVYNVLGEKVSSNPFTIYNSAFTIDLSNQPNGIYLYRVITESGELIGEGKIVIQK